MDAELNALKGLFGDNIGSKIFQNLQDYVTNFGTGSVHRDRRWVTINAVIDSIMWYIEIYNPTKQEDDPVINAVLKQGQPIKESKDLFDIIAKCLANKESLTIMSASIDQFIEAFVTKYGIQISPVLTQDAEHARQKAETDATETDARARGQQLYGQGSTDTLAEFEPRLGRGLAPSSDPLQHTFGDTEKPLRDRILDIEKETRGVIVDLNDPATRIAVFHRLNANATGPIYSLQDVMNEIDQIVTGRGGLPSPVTFPPGNFTREELRLRDEAGKSGWDYGMGPFEKPYFFPKPCGAAAPENRGGNKRIKSKKNSKRRYKKSKKRSNRRRRYSYKK